MELSVQEQNFHLLPEAGFLSTHHNLLVAVQNFQEYPMSVSYCVLAVKLANLIFQAPSLSLSLSLDESLILQKCCKPNILLEALMCTGGNNKPCVLVIFLITHSKKLSAAAHTLCTQTFLPFVSLQHWCTRLPAVLKGMTIEIVVLEITVPEIHFPMMPISS